MISIITICLFFFLGASCGASWSFSDKWQRGWMRRVPEFLTALLIASMAYCAYSQVMPDLVARIGYGLAFLVAFAGVESATWPLLQWDKKNQTHTSGRTFTLMPIVDWIAGKFKWKLGYEGYAWVAATVKGTVICMPFLFLAPAGGLLFAFGYEIGSHAKKYLKGFNLAIISEGLSFVGISIAGLFFIESMRLVFLFL